MERYTRAISYTLDLFDVVWVAPLHVGQCLFVGGPSTLRLILPLKVAQIVVFLHEVFYDAAECTTLRSHKACNIRYRVNAVKSGFTGLNVIHNNLYE